MRKIILINFLFFVSLYLFAERVDLSNDLYFCTMNIPNNIVLNDNFNNQKSNTNKGNLLDITKESYSDFLIHTKDGLSPDLFPDEKDKTVENIMKELKDGKNIFGSNQFVKYNWYYYGEKAVSTQFTQTEITGRLFSYGCYVIRVFLDNNVYVFRLQSPKYNEKKNIIMDKLEEYTVFHKGTITNLEIGVEGSQGYYWKNNNSAEKYFLALAGKQSTLPKEIIDFQISYEQLLNEIKKILVNLK